MNTHPTMALGSTRRWKPTPLITGTVGLAGVEAAFDALGDPEKHAKVLVDPRSAATVPG